ncbi:MAG: aldehyde dehydrogenase family protein, partial [bacterium]
MEELKAMAPVDDLSAEAVKETIIQLRREVADRDPAFLAGGDWQGVSCTAEIHDPSTSEAFGTVAVGRGPDVDAAVEVAASVQPQWAALTSAERREYFERLRDAVVEERVRLAAADSLNAGLPLRGMIADLD